MRGQMYDYYLDPNACLYGLHHGSEPLHVMYNNADGMVMIANNTFKAKHNIMLQANAISMSGKDSLLTQVFVEMEPTRSKKYFSLKPVLDKLAKKEGVFLSLKLLNEEKELLSENLYWLPDSSGNYSGLQQIKKATTEITVKKKDAHTITVVIKNANTNPVAFFNRLSLVNAKTKERILPCFYSDNYVSVLPGEQKTVVIDGAAGDDMEIECYGWNTGKQYIPVRQ
jgi:hypothetical protein